MNKKDAKKFCKNYELDFKKVWRIKEDYQLGNEKIWHECLYKQKSSTEFIEYNITSSWLKYKSYSEIMKVAHTLWNRDELKNYLEYIIPSYYEEFIKALIHKDTYITFLECNIKIKGKDMLSFSVENNMNLHKLFKISFMKDKAKTNIQLISSNFFFSGFENLEDFGYKGYISNRINIVGENYYSKTLVEMLPKIVYKIKNDLRNKLIEEEN